MSYLTQMLALDGAELRVGRDRHGGAGRADPRLHAPAAPSDLGNFWVDLTRGTLYILLPLSLVLALVLVSQGVVQTFDGHAARTLLDRDVDAGRSDGARAESIARRPGRVADRDQAARHERRRLLQRELGAPVREPDAALELPRDARDPADPRRAVLHVRRDGQGPRARAGRSSPRCCVHLRAAARSLTRRGRAARQPGARRARRRSGRERAAAPAATWRARRSASASRHSALWADGDDRGLERLGQRDARQLHAARRARPDVADAARRGRLRRRRLRPLRHARSSPSSRSSSPG